MPKVCNWMPKLCVFVMHTKPSHKQQEHLCGTRYGVLWNCSQRSMTLGSSLDLYCNICISKRQVFALVECLWEIFDMHYKDL